VNIHSIRFRLTAWYAGLLAGALLLFAVSVYVGLKQYMVGSMSRTLAEQSRSIGTELLTEFLSKRSHWLNEEIEEAYAPEANDTFIRVTRSDGAVVYVSGAPKDASFDPVQVPPLKHSSDHENSRKVQLPGGKTLFIESLFFTNPVGTRYLVENGTSYSEIENVLNGLLRLVALYLPFVVSLAGFGGYWLMRRSLKPVDEITSRAEGITSSNLSERLPVIKTGDELERLSTSLNRMIARLEDAFQHIHRFSADASHELRTPLTILQLELEEMIQHHDLPLVIIDQIGSALEETQRLSRIVESLMAISRLDAGEVKMEKVLLDLGELAASTAEQMKLLGEEKAVRLACHVDPGVRVLGDQSRLKQVVVNLIDNAIKYTPQGGRVTVNVCAVEGGAQLEVADNGLGMSPEVISHVFERFYRADKARSRDSGGAGLGLAIVKAICSAHGADIQVASQEGKGSIFRVELPLAHVQEYPAVNDPAACAGTSDSRS
jgi:heavy metal sensor kinase